MSRTVMVSRLSVLMLLFVVFPLSHLFGARDMRIMKAGNESESRLLTEPGLQALYTAAEVDTYCIVWYSFEMMRWQGWTREDNTAQHDKFWHVDNFVGLPEDSYGPPPWPLEGMKSMWCGARPNPLDPYLGSWDTYGYGNNWDQSLVTDPFPFANPLSISYNWYGDFYHAMGDRGDGFVVEYYVSDGECGDSWVEVAGHCLVPYSDEGCQHDSGTDVLQLPPLNQARTKLRFRLISDASCSAQTTSSWGYRGAVVDNITINDATGPIDFEDFEAADVGDGEADGDFNGLHWKADVPVPYGKYSGLKTNLTDKDPCGDDFGTQVVFFIGSSLPSVSYPGLFDTPFCQCSCQNERVISPVIDMTKYSTARNEIQDGVIPPGVLPNLGGVRLEFGVYRDLPLRNLVFYNWSVRNIYDSGYYGTWRDWGFDYYGSDREYFLHKEDISSIVLEDAIQISLGCIDMCKYWYDVSGDCAAHTPAPWFDNVRIYGYENIGPQWSYDDIDLFQDNFPSDGLNIESYVRADAARDENSPEVPPTAILPADYIKVRCTSPKCEGGILYTDGWPEVYMHVRCTYIGPAPMKPDLSEDNGDLLDLGITEGRMLTTGVHPWTIFQAAPPPESPYDEFKFDLSDELFTRGYMIEYYFSANDNCGKSSTLPAYAYTRADATYPDGSGVPGSRYKGVSHVFEFTCLPTLNSDILYVDDCHGRGSFWGAAEDYWNSAFTAVIPSDNLPDRYDVNGPTQFVSNGLGSRARSTQLSEAYMKIIWDSGDLSEGTISDGSPFNDKSPDCQVLNDWMELSDHTAGLWVCGDGVAKDLADCIQNGSAAAAELMNGWCGVDLSANSYFEATGGATGNGIISPLVTGTPAGIFYHAGIADKWVLGGCPDINHFDVLTGIGAGFPAARYPDRFGQQMPAAIQASQLNPGDNAVRTMWFGFSFMYARDTASQSPPIRNHIVKDVIEYMENTANPDISGTAPPAVSDLAQNYPNPFNPATTISYDVARKGPVRISIYNVAGQLVRTLVDEMRKAGRYTEVWDGRNNQGVKTVSGVYFCRMESRDFNRTRKMVILR